MTYTGDWYPGNPTYTTEFSRCKIVDEFQEKLLEYWLRIIKEAKRISW